MNSTVVISKKNQVGPDFVPYGLSLIIDLKDRCFDVRYEDELMNRYALRAANQMFKDALRHGVGRFMLTSGFRSYSTQVLIYDSYENKRYAAKPGQSEHHTGYAFDLYYDKEDPSVEERFQYLYDNCYKYGIILRYPSDKENITGYPYEPWHFRFVGKRAAAYIYKHGLCLEEYVNR
ncbi:MAG: M15 family metallopeptidase [Eubacterium sp.]|nr:M15 family metallopeptidase [Eubacterium sp.]